MAPGRQPRPLRPEDIPQDVLKTFQFDDQALGMHFGRHCLMIGRMCRNCGLGFKSNAAQIRADLKRGRRILGLCGTCAKTPGSHQAGRRKLAKGWYKDAHGYIEQWIPGRGYVKQHRFVMEQSLGRLLRSFEHVHHRNGKRDDNRSENLELWTSPRQPFGQRAVEKHCPTCQCATETHSR
jgi:hypothetical protein